jgi:hypothetical protein
VVRFRGGTGVSARTRLREGATTEILVDAPDGSKSSSRTSATAVAAAFSATCAASAWEPISEV